MTELAVTASNLAKVYRTYPEPTGRLVEWFTRGRVKKHQEKWALEDVSFDVPRGSAMGVIGANGAGKSTLLKIISGVTEPTRGSYAVNGRLSSLLELGAGFHPEFSGRDNIFMNATILGMSKADVRERFAEIADFADLGPFLDQPLRTYSSGMAMRVAFAVAMLADPEILILDEVLAVGDQEFQKKCMDRIAQIRQSGTSILFVSHSIYHVRQICDRAIWIHGGKIVMGGPPNDVTDEYANYFYAEAAGRDAKLAQTGHAVTAGMAHLTDVKVCPMGTDEARTEFDSGETVDVWLGYKNPGGEGRFHLGLIVNRNDEVQVFTTRSLESGLVVDGTEGYGVARFNLKMTAGEFYVSGFLLDESCDHVLDQRQAWTRFHVNHDGPELGVFRADCTWHVEAAMPCDDLSPGPRESV